MSTVYHLPAYELQDIFVNCWTDPQFQEAFIADPRKILADWGVHVPAGIKLEVAQDTHDFLHIVIPLPPQPDEIKPHPGKGVPMGDCVMSACRPCASYKERGTAV